MSAMIKELTSNPKEFEALLEDNVVKMVPMINPDGDKYNHTTNPGGGGMHRKNRNPIYRKETRMVAQIISHRVFSNLDSGNRQF